KLEHFYALAVVLGSAYGGVMPLYAVLARGYFAPRIMGGILGAATMASSLGMSFGPVAGGWIYDHFGNYGWLYLGSPAVGSPAFSTASGFPKPAEPKDNGALPQPA